MRRLSETLAHLASLAAPHGEGHFPSSSLDEITGFGSNPGGLRGWVHAPVDRPARAPMVVVLHGCTQDAAGYNGGAGWSTLADRHGFVVLLPEQQRANNANGCFNWFDAGDVSRGSGEALSIRQMIAAASAAHDVDPGRIFITGLSAGGAMASAMLATYPELFASGAIIAGLPYGTAHNLPEALERMRGRGGARGEALGALLRAASTHRGPWPTLSVWHGTADPTVNRLNADLIVDQWKAVHGVDDPDPETAVAGYPRTAWRDGSGRVVIERFDITGMGHGTPLATTVEDGVGAPGPFMLEAAISSTHHIARFWGLIGEADMPREPVGTPRAATRRPPVDRKPFAGPAAVIDDALRAAGLVR